MATTPMSDSPAPVDVVQDWTELFAEHRFHDWQPRLITYLQQQRWFPGKARAIRELQIEDVLEPADTLRGAETDGAPEPDELLRLLVIRIEYAGSPPDRILLPVAIKPSSAGVLSDADALVPVRRQRDGSDAMLYDATRTPALWQQLFAVVSRQCSLTGTGSRIEVTQTRAFQELASDLSPDVNVHAGEQSNSSAVLGGRLIFKLFRQLSEGENPDLEIGRFLTESADLTCVARVAGALTYIPAQGTAATLAVVHQFMPHRGDAWNEVLRELQQFLARAAASDADSLLDVRAAEPASPLAVYQQSPPATVRAVIGPFYDSVRRLGTRTAELHLALAGSTEKDFQPEPISAADRHGWYTAQATEARAALQTLREQLPQFDPDTAKLVQRLLSLEARLIERYADLSRRSLTALKLRCHGDYHLGQVLATDQDFVIVDFEGEPARPIHERRQKRSPLVDVAGMIRSLHYAAQARSRMDSDVSMSDLQRQWLALWYRWCAAAFLSSYLETARRGNFLPASQDELTALLEAQLLQKAVYELMYEANNRPGWLSIPLVGVLELLDV